MIRRRQNHVCSLVNERGEWIDDPIELKRMAAQFYSNPFQVDPSCRGEFIKDMFYPISNEQRAHLTTSYSMEDMRKALMSMGSFKAP